MCSRFRLDAAGKRRPDRQRCSLAVPLFIRARIMHRNITAFKAQKCKRSTKDGECTLPIPRECSVCQRPSGERGGEGGRGWRRVRNGERVRCVCSTRAIVREDYLSIVCRSLALSLSTAAATPVVQYLTSRPALFRGFCATREKRRRCARARLRTLLSFGYLTESEARLL